MSESFDKLRLTSFYNKMKEITVQELKAKLDANDDFQLIDVREQKEFDFVNIDGELIPLG